MVREKEITREYQAFEAGLRYTAARHRLAELKRKHNRLRSILRRSRRISTMCKYLNLSRQAWTEYREFYEIEYKPAARAWASAVEQAKR